MTVDSQPPKVKTILPPKTGWKADTYYLVEVAYGRSNPIHRAILGVGFLGVNAPKGEPGNYSAVWCNSYEAPNDYREVYYLKVIKELCAFS